MFVFLGDGCSVRALAKTDSSDACGHYLWCPLQLVTNIYSYRYLNLLNTVVAHSSFLFCSVLLWYLYFYCFYFPVQFYDIVYEEN